MTKRPSQFSTPDVDALIVTVRGQKVLLDSDLARIYGVPTKVFNQAINRNQRRFPADFCFQLTAGEFATLRLHPTTADSSQIAMSSSQPAEKERVVANWSQIVTSSKRHRGAAYRPWAFTEHGALMAANVLRSKRAVEMSLYVIRAFVKMREGFAANAAILKRLAEIDRTLLLHDTALRDIYRKLLPLLSPPPEPPRRQIGFHVAPDKPTAKARSRTVHRHPPDANR